MRQPRKRLVDVMLGAALALLVAPTSIGQWGDRPAENATPNGHAPIPNRDCGEPSRPDRLPTVVTATARHNTRGPYGPEGDRHAAGF
jgi:hypothetical protein